MAHGFESRNAMNVSVCKLVKLPCSVGEIGVGVTQYTIFSLQTARQGEINWWNKVETFVPMFSRCIVYKIS